MKVRLGDICSQVTDGSHNPPTSVFYSERLMLSSKNIYDDQITIQDPRFLSEADYQNENKRTNIMKGDLLITIVGTVGRVAVVPESFSGICVQRSVAVIKPKHDIVYNRFLMYQLQNMRPYLEQEARGVAQKGIYLKQVSQLPIVLPPLDEQRRIAAVLDKVSDLIAKRRAQLDKLEELVKARFVEMFGDPLIDSGRYTKVPLGSLVEVGSSKRIFEKEYVREGIPFYRTKEIVELSKGNQITTELFITRQRYDEIKKEYGVPKAGDLLISAVGTIGVIWIVDGKNNFYFKDGNLLRVVTNEKFTPIYLKHLLETLIGAYKLKMSSGTAYAALTISALKEMLVYEVPIEEQKQFASFVEQTDKSKLTIQQSLDKLKILKKALMQQYFG